MATILPSPPRVGMVSLGCPKALVDSERILTKLRADGYQMSPDYAGADVVLVNTCGFLDSAKEESLEAIGEAIAENGRVVVTGCMGREADVIRARFPKVLAITGPQQYDEVVAAGHAAAPPIPNAYLDLVPQADIGAGIIGRHLIAVGAQLGQDALAVDQCLGTAERNHADARRGGEDGRHGERRR